LRRHSIFGRSVVRVAGDVPVRFGAGRRRDRDTPPGQRAGSLEASSPRGGGSSGDSPQSALGDLQPRLSDENNNDVGLLTAAIIGLWAGAVYEPTALIFLSRQAGMDPAESVRMASYGTGLLSIGGCLAAPWLAERIGRRSTLAVYYLGMLVTIVAAFGWASYLPGASAPSRIHDGTVLPWSVRWQFCNLQLGSTIMETALVMASKNTRRDLRPVMRTWLGRIPATASSILKLAGGILMLRGLSVANSCQSLNDLY
jgi:hypothetical protein